MAASDKIPVDGFRNGVRALIVAVSFVLECVSGGLSAAPPSSSPASKELLFPGQVFQVNRQTAFVMLPEESLRNRPQPWVWYAPTLPGLPDAHEKWMHEKLLQAGIAVAGIDIGESFGNRTGRDAFSDFYQEMTERRGFAGRVVLLGRSRGGLMICNWAV